MHRVSKHHVQKNLDGRCIYLEHLREAVCVWNQVAEATVHTVQITNPETSSGSQKLCAVISAWRVVSYRLC